MVDGDVAVGTRLPPDVALVEIPEDPQYADAVVNHHRVIVDPKIYNAEHFQKKYAALMEPFSRRCVLRISEPYRDPNTAAIAHLAIVLSTV